MKKVTVVSIVCINIYTHTANVMKIEILFFFNLFHFFFLTKSTMFSKYDF